jgi:hypothetical protein
LCLSTRATSKCLFVLKFPQLGLPRIWRCIISLVDLQSQWGLKQSCSPRWELSNGMLHSACTQGNQVDSWLLVVWSQTVNSFGHNLCFRCSNGWCEPILDIYASITFSNEIKNFLEWWILTPAIVLWRFRNHFGTHESSIKRVRVHSLTLFALSGTCDVTHGSPYWPTTFQPLALVVSPRLGLRHLDSHFNLSRMRKILIYGYWCLFYSWLLIAILLMVISGYYELYIDYWWLLYYKLLLVILCYIMIIGDYFIISGH